MMYVSKGREYCSTLGIFVPPKGLCNTSQLVCFQSPQEAMKIRTITVGLQVQPEDFVEVGGTHAIGSKLLFARRSLDDISNSLKSSGYEVQTLRISLNSFEQWLLLDDQSYGNGCGIASYIEIVEILVHYLTLYSIELCSIGCCSSSHAIALIPSLLAVSERLSCSALFRGTKLDDITPDDVLIKAAARTLISVAKTLGVAGCFRYCASFNCAGGLPFFPAAFFESDGTSDSSDRGVAVKEGFLVSVGLECADLLFIAFHGALSASEGNALKRFSTYSCDIVASVNYCQYIFVGSRNLSEVMMQALLPIQNIVSTSCTLLNIEYGGIDASINPGMSLPESVAAGLENLLFIPELPKNLLTPAPAQQFGKRNQSNIANLDGSK